MSTTTPQTIIVPPRRRGRGVLLLWGATLLLGGIGIGIGGTLLLHPRPPAPPPPPPPPGVPDFRPGPIVERMNHDLKLTADQTKQVTDAYAQRLEAIKSLRGDMVIKLSAEHEKLREAMKQILTPLQFAQWDQSFEAMRSRLMPDAPPPPRLPEGPAGGGPLMGRRLPPDDPLGLGPGGGPRGQRPGGPGSEGPAGGDNAPGPNTQEPPPGPP
jgi:Spy/CpxP family protein refolding chaperone